MPKEAKPLILICEDEKEIAEKFEAPAWASAEGALSNDIACLTGDNGHGKSALLDAMPSVDLAVADTMGLWIDVARPDLEALLGRVHGVVMNEEEAAAFTNAPSLVDAAFKLLDLGPNFSVVKKGQHGCIVAAREGLVAWGIFQE